MGRTYHFCPIGEHWTVSIALAHLAWWEELLLRDPRFQARVSQARSSLRDGKGISIEELREKHNIKSQ